MAINTTQQKCRQKATTNLLEKEHELTTRTGLLDWLAAVGVALTHDLPQMPVERAAISVKLSNAVMNILRSEG